MPASLVDFAMNVGAQLFADGAKEALLHFLASSARPIVESAL
jgi:hypothetical protein